MDILTFKNTFINNTNTDDYIHVEDGYKIKILDKNSQINLIEDCDYIIFDDNIYFNSTFGDYLLLELDENFNNIFEILGNKYIHIFNPTYGWFTITRPNTLKVEINEIKNVFLGQKILDYDEDIFDFIPDELKYNNDLFEIDLAYARCEKSMELFDKINRKKINKLVKQNKNEIIAIKAVAGSGKTTTLLNLADIIKTKILYIAFNKALIEEVDDKKRKLKKKNIYPNTFDKLMRNIFISRTNIQNPNITDLKPTSLSKYDDNFNSTPWSHFRFKKTIVKKINLFCNQIEYDNIDDFIKNTDIKDKSPTWIKIFKNIWNLMINFKIITFDSIRKIILINHWAKDYIDKNYKYIFIDEAQDFDTVMLKILLDDTTIPKLFVGDTLQAIYQWRGSINSFDYLPREKTITIEFYTSFRVGNPACEIIRSKFENCYMIAGNNNYTELEIGTIPEDKHVYLFRSWKGLLLKAKETSNIFIKGFDKQIESIKKQHEALSKKTHISEEELSEYEDDLPSFLIKLTLEQLTDLIDKIKNNLVDVEDAICIMTTIHSFKGLESDIVRIYDDIDVHKEPNLYYVALTRGIKKIICDKEYGNVKSNIQIDTIINDENSDFIKLLIEGKTTTKIAELNNIDEAQVMIYFLEINFDFDLLEKLKIYRVNKARQENKPPFCIFTNKTLKNIILNKPTNKKDFLKIIGLGKKTYDSYGNDIIKIINE
tara:strand:+ start:355 stop:2490 length:2136 start_codon:yes stop_codon:yes gene_type:complete